MAQIHMLRGIVYWAHSADLDLRRDEFVFAPRRFRVGGRIYWSHNSRN